MCGYRRGAWPRKQRDADANDDAASRANPGGGQLAKATLANLPIENLTANACLRPNTHLI